ncbi:MAG: DNA polymerase III subunit gamma/tau [Deltaproteobacteria bacterium]|nr:DNA polymerase III subunit gamma/tau [Deltaproteobacteria bacterium]
MSYLVLARSSRPQKFEEVVGQKPVVKTLQNSLKRNRVAHAILFSGVRGIGKTTLARLMAKALNCEEGPTPVPCGNCSSCRQIVAGSSLDLHEIDGASNRGIQEVRELKEKIKFMPASSRYKIVIIDEVHMLTTEAFNALLKTLEEPPKHVYFMFATTELHKIPITILSRCQRYELQRIRSDSLSEHLQRLAQNENIELEKGALSLIVREAEGSVRDGLSLLDQVISYGESPIQTSDVVDILGLVNRDILHNISLALLSGNKKEALGNLAEAFIFGIDIKRFMADLLEHFRALLLVKIDGCKVLLDIAAEDLQRFEVAAAEYSTETIHQKLSLLMRTAEDIRYSVQPRLTLETAFLSIIEAGNVVGVSTLLERLDKTIKQLPKSISSPDNTPAFNDLLPSETASFKKKIVEESAPSTEDEKDSAHFEAATIENHDEPRRDSDEIPTPSAPSLSEQVVVDQQTESSEPQMLSTHQRDIRRDWLDFISYVKERKQWMSQNLQQAATVRDQGQELLLEYEDPAECTLLRSKENRKLLTEYVLDFFQKEYIIHFVTPEDTEDPDMKASEGPKKRRQELASNPLVRMTEEIFGGHVGEIRVGPLSR